MDTDREFRPLRALRGAAAHTGRDWPCIFAADERSIARIQELRGALRTVAERFPNSVVYAYGSLARREATSGSDVDWMVVHDGPVSVELRDITRLVTESLSDLGVESPSETSEFGKVCSSLDLVASVASKHDSRLLLSRRMLTIFEAVALTNADRAAGVVGQLLHAYQTEETLSEFSKYYVPRYLLNDLNQFWRLMCTDYSGRSRAREGRQWGLRSVKLNYSRFLLFICGALRCFDFEVCRHRSSAGAGGPRSVVANIYSSLASSLETPPLEVLATHLPVSALQAVLDEYEHFLASLDAPDVRARLAALRFEESDDDQVLIGLWQRSRVFRDAVEDALLAHPVLSGPVKRCLLA